MKTLKKRTTTKRSKITPSAPYLYAKDFSVDSSRRTLSLELLTGDRYEVKLDEVSKRLQGVPADGLLDSYFIGGGCGIRWPMVDEDLSVRGIVRHATSKLR